MSWLVRSRRRQGEQGAVAIIVAICLVPLLLIAGFVINVGLARTDKLSNKAYTDAAAAAGIAATYVAGDPSSHPFSGACTALAYLLVNDPDLAGLTSSWKTGAGVTLAGNPCAAGSASLSATCVPNSPSSWAWYTGTSITSGSSPAGRLTVDIRSGYVTPDPLYDPAGSGDNGLSAEGGCDQLAVILHESQAPGLGSVAGGGNLVTAVRSVGRAVSGTGSASATALLILERDACVALQTTGTSQIQVLGNGTASGSIQVDSLGDSCTSGAKVISADISTIIKAQNAETGTAPGTITVTALSGAAGAVAANATSPTANVCAEQSSGVCAAATGAFAAGRAPVDKEYLGTASPPTGVTGALALAAVQYNKTANFGNTAAGVAYTTYTCSPPLTSTAVAIFINCPAGLAIGGGSPYSYPNATDFVVNGSLQVGNGGSLALPLAVRVYVKGAAGGKGINVDGIAFLNVNLGSASTCAGRGNTPTAQVVVGNGYFATGASGILRLCNTTVLMADNNNNVAPSCALPTLPETGLGPAPYDNGCDGYISLTGAGIMDWTAPNLVSGQATAADWLNLEDLAFWTETSVGNDISGSGNMKVTGVFMTPNANPFTITGGSSQSTGQNAQFVARRLTVQGSSVMYLRPNINDTVNIAGPPSFDLVR